MAQKLPTDHKNLENVEHVLTNAEQFIEDNQKILTYVAIAIVALVAGFFGFKKFYMSPKEKEAQSQIFVAEQYFEKDSFNMALNGDGSNLGFLQVIDEYGITKTAKLAEYYAGICYYKLNNYQSAIEHLKKFKSKDKLVAPIAMGVIGDANLEMGNKDAAADYYLKAANLTDNDFTTPIYLMKAGGVFELLGKYKQALEQYQQIKDKYPTTMEGRQIDKYITRAQIKAGV